MVARKEERTSLSFFTPGRTECQNVTFSVCVVVKSMESFYNLIPSFFQNTSSVPLLFCYGLLLNFIPLTAVWMVSVGVKNASVIDCYWSLAFVLLNSIYIHFSGHTTNSNAAFTLLQEWKIPYDRRALVTLLLQVWAVKLSLYMLWRKIGEPEDFRYREFRRIVTEKGKSFWWVSYFRVYLFQGRINFL